MLDKPELLQTSDLTIPLAIAFTPDKNRTWADSFGLSVLDGHSRGKETVRTIANECFDLGVRDVIVWAMSESNIHKRPSYERDHLVKLLKAELVRQEQEAKEDEGFYLCGRWQKIIKDSELEDLVGRAHARNAKARYQAKRLTVLFAYRGITDQKQAQIRVARELDIDALDNEDLTRSRMWIAHLHQTPIEMFVRTGVTDKTRHNSDSFLPYHGEHAFVHDVPVYWPEFTVEHLHQGIKNFSACKRLKGA